MNTAGQKMQHALKTETPLQIVGAINAYSAMQAQRAGFKAVYLSGGGVAYASNGYPDLGITDLHDVLEEARKITGAVDIPLLADIDVGWGGAFNIARTIKEMQRAGVAAVHMEDQIAQKRCGHRPNKELVSKEEMGDRIRAAIDAKTDPDFIVMARCDALASEGLDGVIERCAYYVECGADSIFAEAMTDLAHYQKIRDAVQVPLLANITEFGKTDLYTVDELGAHGVDMALYPLSAFRAMAKAAETVYNAIRKDGTQKNVVDLMQTRADLYDVIDNATYEEKLDKLFGK
ncbi:MAG: methylisocitrate lyase [Alphaproteobacteria bacterium CG_4_9_14_3_um_filter_47_13]|nr:MAG: methylisocitrate lyase [Alphaproteobacteria bacterium CG_4_9_14_3_um_filter_47_13]